jgi:hypothetical protein
MELLTAQFPKAFVTSPALGLRGLVIKSLLTEAFLFLKGVIQNGRNTDKFWRVNRCDFAVCAPHCFHIFCF